MYSYERHSLLLCRMDYSCKKFYNSRPRIFWTIKEFLSLSSRSFKKCFLFVKKWRKNKRICFKTAVSFMLSVVWCLVKGNKSHGKVTQRIWNHRKLIISMLIDALFVPFIWNTHVSFPTVISQPMPFYILSYALSLTQLICFSLSLSPSLLLTPRSVLTCLNLI